jgi:hypothetical protein
VFGDLSRHDVSVVTLGYSNKNIRVFDTGSTKDVFINSITNDSTTFILLTQAAESFALQVYDRHVVTFFVHEPCERRTYASTAQNYDIHYEPVLPKSGSQTVMPAQLV